VVVDSRTWLQKSQEQESEYASAPVNMLIMMMADCYGGLVFCRIAPLHNCKWMDARRSTRGNAPILRQYLDDDSLLF
jgi:hypothetical protein